MRYIKIIILFTFLGFSNYFSAQSADEAEKFFDSKQYVKAKSIYENLLKKKPADPLYNYRLARCCYELKNFTDAVTYFENTSSKYSMRDIYLADSYFETYQFGKAKDIYLALLNETTQDQKKIADYTKRIDQCILGQNLLNRIEDIAITDSLVVSKTDFLKFYHLNKDAGTIEWDKIKLNNKTSTDKITYLTQRGDRKIFSDSIKGSTDIFTSYKLLNEWSSPTSISNQVNTRFNENYPFLMLDGVTLYFASDRPSALGGLDIYITKFSPNAQDFLNPENVGFPFNSPYNDYMLAIDESNKKGWFVTDRYLTTAKVTIYSFILNDTKNYIRTEDSVALRQFAQLKKFRKANQINHNNSENLSLLNQNFSKKMNFIINDSTIYSSENQFYSKQALDDWRKLTDLQESNSSQSVQLDQLRYQFANADEDISKTKLKKLIIESELKLIDYQKNINKLTKEIRREEIKALEKK